MSTNLSAIFKLFLAIHRPNSVSFCILSDRLTVIEVNCCSQLVKCFSCCRSLFELPYKFDYYLRQLLTHTCPFDSPLSGTTRVSWYQKGKTNLNFTEARDSEWQWHLLGHMQVCTSLQTDNHASTPTTQFFTGRMLFLPANKQRQSTECCYKISQFCQPQER